MTSFSSLLLWSLGCLCLKQGAFKSICICLDLKNDPWNRGPFDSEKLWPFINLKGGLMWKLKARRNSVSCRKPPFRGGRVWKQVKAIQFPWLKPICFSEYLKQFLELYGKQLWCFSEMCDSVCSPLVVKCLIRVRSEYWRCFVIKSVNMWSLYLCMLIAKAASNCYVNTF